MDIIDHVATAPNPLACPSRSARPLACPSCNARPPGPVIAAAIGPESVLTLTNPKSKLNLYVGHGAAALGPESVLT